MGHLIGPNVAAWYDFWHMKCLKFTLPLPSPKNRMQFREGENGAHRVYRDPKLARLPMGPLTASISAP